MSWDRQVSGPTGEIELCGRFGKRHWSGERERRYTNGQRPVGGPVNRRRPSLRAMVPGRRAESGVGRCASTASGEWWGGISHGWGAGFPMKQV